MYNLLAQMLMILQNIDNDFPFIRDYNELFFEELRVSYHLTKLVQEWLE